MKLLITLVLLCAMSATGCTSSDISQPVDIFTNEVINIKCSYDEFLTLTNKYPHSTDSFTQGLFFHDDKLYESTGLYGNSKLFKNIDITTGNYEKEFTFTDDIFAEGSVVFNNKLYVLTYKENKVLVFDPETPELQKTLPYNREGWGLTTDGKSLIASDGSSKIYFMDEILNDIKHITVTNNGKEISRINIKISFH